MGIARTLYISSFRSTLETISVQSQRFHSLQCQWTLQPVDMDKCNVDFEVQMTVSDIMIAQVLDQLLETVASRQVEAFDKRCQEIPIPDDLITRK